MISDNFQDDNARIEASLEWFKQLHTQIKKEIKEQQSDRTLVIIYTIYLNDEITKLLEDCLVNYDDSSHYPKMKDDTLFADYRPLHDFGPKIDCAYRIGLISAKLAQDLHRIRKMRNDVAHDREKYALNKDLVTKLSSALITDMPFWREYYEKEIRGDFEFIARLLLHVISGTRYLFNESKSKLIEMKKAHRNEWIYDESKRKTFDKTAREAYEKPKRNLAKEFQM